MTKEAKVEEEKEVQAEEKEEKVSGEGEVKVEEEKEVQASEYPMKVKMDAKDDVIGMFVVLWRNESKQAAKCMGIDDAKGRVVYELVSGPDKGKRFSAKYDSSQTVNVYDKESVILAVLDT